MTISILALKGKFNGKILLLRFFFVGYIDDLYFVIAEFQIFLIDIRKVLVAFWIAGLSTL